MPPPAPDTFPEPAGGSGAAAAPPAAEAHDEILDLADTYGRLNYAPEHIWLHGIREYKTAKAKGLLTDRAFFARATRLKKNRR